MRQLAWVKGARSSYATKRLHALYAFQRCEGAVVSGERVWCVTEPPYVGDLAANGVGQQASK